MKVKNILAAIGLLMLTAATGAWAVDQTCNSGKIVKSPDPGMGAVGAGYLAPSGAFYAGSRYIGLQCDTAVGTWVENTPRTFVISANSAYDPDGKYATALTAYALGKKVSFTAFTFATATPDNAMCLSIGPAPTYTCNTTGRVLKAIAMLPDSAM